MSDTPTVQSEKGRSVIEAVPVLHPFLLALYPLLGLYAFNQERTLFSAVFRPGLAMVAAAFVLWLALGAFFRNGYKAGVVASLLVVAATSGWNVLEYAMSAIMTGLSGQSAVLYYAAFGLAAAAAILAVVWYSKSSTWDRIRLGVLMAVVAAALLYMGDIILAPIFQRGPAWAMLSYFVTVAGLVLLVHLWKSDFRRATSTLNLFGFILLGLSVANILINRPAVLPVIETPEPIAQARTMDTRPDIWFIALNGYARPDALGNLYGYNARPFLSDLASRGFTTVEESTANYATPFESLASCLNMDYLGTPDAPLTTIALANYYHNNSVAAFLRSQGYRVCTSPPPNELLKPRGRADRPLESNALPSEFEVVLLESTAISRMVQATHYIRHRSLAELRHIVSRARTVSTLESMRALATEHEDGPRFVQAYLSVPNAPFVFDREGEWPESVGEYTYGGRALFRGGMREYQDGYTEQVHWLNNELLTLIDEIRAHAEIPPIILLVSMQGPTGPPGGTPEQRELLMRQLFLNFMSLHLPDSPEVPADLTPVNLFRFVFQEDLGDGYPMLPNLRYLVQGDELVEFGMLP